MARILIVDDEENIRASLKAALEKRGHDCVTAAGFAEGQQFARADFDIVFLDVFLGDGSGIDLLKELQARDPRQCVVMISGDADIDTAVQAIQIGAYDFVEKPISLDRILITVDHASRASRLLSEKERLSGIVYGDLVGESEAVRKIKADITRSASRTDRFLVLGENGTGKELAAHLIHRQSKRADGPFIAINCAALPSELVESELFGHEKGAFTGATKSRKGKFVEASGGSIFLDEISEMPADAQAKILRATETRRITPVGSDSEISVDCTIIAASNRDLEIYVAEGKFRQDLYYRLNVVTLTLPALRDRSEDIPLLADHFLARFAAQSGGTPQRLSDEAAALLRRYPFPGNVRELKNLIERISIYCDDTVITAEFATAYLPPATSRITANLKAAVEAFEREHISSIIADHAGNMTEAARHLGLERSHLYKKMKKLGLG
ncbi:MAG: sigma-54 dependent transcriptional regulator [candidate division Zixibacteria bacterium]|nr:sigma-54 dependent transcriptional regulator [candidate division Zixibacteria bacterium]